jgi:uncharacterized protein (UPF0254 family)
MSPSESARSTRSSVSGNVDDVEDDEVDVVLATAVVVVSDASVVVEVVAGVGNGAKVSASDPLEPQATSNNDTPIRGAASRRMGSVCRFSE